MGFCFCLGNSIEWFLKFCWSKVGSGVILMLWQLWCHCNSDHDKFSFTVVAIFPNVCLWRRSLCSNLENCIEPTSYASTAYVVAIWPWFLFDSFVKIWDTCENFLGKWFTAPLAKNFRYAYGCKWQRQRVQVHKYSQKTAVLGFLWILSFSLHFL